MPNGDPNQTIRCKGTNGIGWIAEKNLQNNGTNVGISLDSNNPFNIAARLYVNGLGTGNVFAIKADNPNRNGI